MPSSVDLKCLCGSVKGSLDIVPKSYFHVHCLCCDCQRFASNLKNEANILDAHGGTELLQTYPAFMKITEGFDKIECMQFGEKGLYRWYASCCNMPLANTMRSPSTPFIGVPVKLMQFADEQEKNKIIGPVLMKAFGKYAIGEMPKDAHPKFPMSYIPKIVGFMIKGIITRKNKPSPFFTHDGKPIATPK